MRSSALWLVLLAAMALVLSPAPGAEFAGKVQTDPIGRLIGRLGSNAFQEREDATRALDGLGAAALPALQKAARQDDPEVRRRAQALIRKIEKRLETEKVLAPKRVRLVYEDKPVLEAVVDFNKHTGFNIQVDGDKTKLAGRHMTLDTGEVSLWEALDQLCEKGNLTDPDPAAKRSTDASLDAKRRALMEREVAVMRLRAVQMKGYGYSSYVAPFDGRIHLVDGKPQSLPTCRTGAVRIRALPPSAAPASAKAEEKALMLEVTPEPKMAWRGVLDLQIAKAVDDNGQAVSQAIATTAETLALGMPAQMLAFDVNSMPLMNSRQLPVRLKCGRQPSKALTELQGTVTAQVQVPPQPLLTIDNVLKAAGQSAENEDGDSLKLLEVERSKTGQITIRVQFSSNQGLTLWGGGGRVMRRRVVAGGGIAFVEEASPGNPSLSLVDAQGRAYRLANTSGVSMMQNFAGMTQETLLTYQAQKGQGEPAKLVLTAPRVVIVDVPFTLKNVPLP